jgi:SAM-dependent methyltransferase
VVRTRTSALSTVEADIVGWLRQWIRLAALKASTKRRILSAAPASSRVFHGIYEANYWSGTESRSGTGSSLEQTRVIRDVLPSLIASLSCRSLLDAPCGDFHWLSRVSLGLDYTGYDIVESVIAANRSRYENSRTRFFVADMTVDRVPHVDLILCRDGLVHLSYDDIFLALDNFIRSGARYLLTTTFRDRPNRNIVTGDWRPLDLGRWPFLFPKALMLINEDCSEFGGIYRDKSLGLWDMTGW